MLNFTAIDFETANSYWGSPCAVGVVKVSNGTVVHQQAIYMRPPEARDYFEPRNTAIHGITADQVADAPRWRQVLPDLLDLIGDDLVVAHNASFDTGVVRHACDADQIETPNLEFLCTLVMARHTLDLPAYRLPHVAAALGVTMGAHHDPLADAQAAAGITMALAHRVGVSTVNDLASCCQVHKGRIGTGFYRGCTRIHTSSRSYAAEGTPGNPKDIPAPNPDADPAGALFGLSIVFSSGLDSMTREDAWRACAELGAILQKGVTKATNILVVGGAGPAYLRPGIKPHSKEAKALTLQQAGQDIRVVGEDEFLRLLAS
ncbi:MAG TPA: hypothetical protein DCM67_01845 [Propionibacteriaceae bacterium]|nr:hypothetical protein [Propionibacteriaceae bacterium]